VFLVGPDREPDRTPRQPREPAQTYMPFSRPPAKPKSWWGTMPGQLAVLAMLGGGFVILLGLLGIIGPLSMR
jgi:predicted lipid-binding transport protein (Tim44 family)